MTKLHYSCVFALLLAAMLSDLHAGERDRSPRDRQSVPARTADIKDRAQNVVTINKLGQTVTNLGQFYPFSGTLPAGRWPIGTDHDAIYKMNMYVGVPNNVVSTRAANVKEWDAIPGFNNPDSGKIALSTDSTTWPRNALGRRTWPVRTPDGRDSILSQQDSYAVYNDRTNNRASTDPLQRLHFTVYQSTYAWSTSKDEDYVVVKFEVVNDTTAAKDSVYFGLYCDFDSGGPERDYEDDLWGVDRSRQFFFIKDADGISLDWGPTVKPFVLGMVFLETPEVNGRRPGLTDWHYSSDADSPWGDIVSEDAILYQWMSSNPALKANPVWPNLFHGQDIRFDDVSLINPKGQRLDAIGASGPYRMEAGQRLTFIAALVAGQDSTDLSANVDRVIQIYGNGLQLIPPPQVDLRPTAFDNSVRLQWSNDKELTYLDVTTGKTLVKEYRVYRTQDPQRKEWGSPVAVVPQNPDLVGVVPDAYSWQDTAKTQNYFYYSYSVTTVDKDGLESGKAFLPADQTVKQNTAEVRPADSQRQSLGAVRVVPNPYVVSALWERKRLGDPLLGEPVRDLAFTNLPSQCTIKIYTLFGDLVKTIEHTNGTGTEYWDIRSSANQLVATGIYFYHIASPVGELVSKFAIVR